MMDDPSLSSGPGEIAAASPVVEPSADAGSTPATAPLAESLAETLAAPAVSARPVPGPVASSRREGDRGFGVGRRKTAVARVMIVPGAGRMTINKREPKEYFRRVKLLDELTQPFAMTGMAGRFDTTVVVSGSSLASQAGAVRLGISRALAGWQPDLRPALSTGRLLRRDPRMVERKKYGFRGARRRPQWTKR